MATLSKDLLTQIYNRYKDISKDPVPEPESLSATRMAVMVENTLDKPQQGQEKIRGTNNLTSVSTLLRGYEVGCSVGLVFNMNRSDIDSAAIGTGFLIAPGIFVTNNHVIPTIADAERFGLLMNYQRDLDGNLDTLYKYRFEPQKYFYTSEVLDFTILAVEPEDYEGQKRLLDSFGYLRLLEESGKITEGEFASLIEHPNGKPKQVVLYENSILYDKHSQFLLYSADTDEGASGSPLFNYEWTVVALHHAGVPQSLDQLRAIDDELINENEYPKAANEGIRISAIMSELKESYNPSAKILYGLIHLAAKAPVKASLPSRPFEEARHSFVSKSAFENTSFEQDAKVPTSRNFVDQNIENAVENQKNIIRLNIPIEIHLGQFSEVNTVSVTPTEQVNQPILEKRSSSDPVNRDINDRQGYQHDFLGFNISLENLYKPFSDKGLLAATLDEKMVLNYTHFSLVMHKVRRMCVITAVNIDGNLAKSVPRNDNWQLDGRMDTKFQLGNAIYLNNDLDRGHMVRREDPNWGPEAAQANADTFHYTNSCPQHKDLNQKSWLSLENYVLSNTKLLDLKISVFTGPVLDENYVHYREALVPVQFYKIVAMIKKDGTPSITGYVLTQKELISGLESVMTEFVFAEFKTYQLSLDRIEEMTGLDLGALKPFDPLKGALESLPREISDASDLII